MHTSRRPRPTPLRTLGCALLALLGIAAAEHSNAQDAGAAALFSRFKDRIVQVRLVDLQAEEKAALGTGFLVAEAGLIATNFHVISGIVHEPERYRLESLDVDGNKGDLSLLDVDVINDLALLRTEQTALVPLALRDDAPTQGETIYSLGNPHDIGFTVVPGTYNGLESGSYYEHIHFSGSVNSGMSGGPVLDRAGRVVGVNVSTAGNQVSFLVPGKALRALIGDHAAKSAPIEDFQLRVRAQLLANQKELIDRVLAREWPTQKLGEATTVGEMQPFVKCWGDSSDEDELFNAVSSSCSSPQHLYLKWGFSSGVIAYQFFWIEAGELSGPRFTTYYDSLFGSYVPDNQATEDDVGEYACDERFVEDDAGHTDKAVLCIRAYKAYEGLYDALYVRGSVDDAERAFMSHFTLAGIDRQGIEAFLRRFQEVARR